MLIAFFSQNKYIIPIARWQAFINKTEISIPYRIDRNPDTTDVERVFINPEAGTNCELLVHSIVSARGFELPRLRSSDLYEDTNYTSLVEDISQAQTGDIIGLSPINKNGFRGIHVAMIWIDDSKKIHIVHNARHTGGVRLQTLEDAMQHPEHARIAWIKRPIRENPTLLQSEKLRELDFGYLARDL
ncbi:MAG: hypothetical protein A3B44_00520 [Candidatus Levybacteria bacterium RIFCSPLOWO2_01_FULL_38_21]|nr:MAG: hypothetical protein A3B44_00520 [Candidatus Levybacteria bacterium RIFCSPLOWO2_01_FULL_38_21]